MSTEIKIQCECGHAKLISKSNISAHRKSKIHAKNMLALGTVETTEVENTIICTEVVIKNKPEKNVKPKCIDCNKRQISKDSLRSRKQKCNKCWYKYTNEKYSPKNNEPEEEESEPEEEESEPEEEEVETIEEEEVETIEEEEVETIEEVIKTIEEEAKPVEEVKPVVSCDITEFLQRIETQLKKIDDFNTSITSQLIDCDILDIVKSIDKRLKKIEELQEVSNNNNRFDDKDVDPLYRYTIWTQKQYFTNRVIDEIKRRKHPIFKGIDEDEEESETTTIVENQRDEEVVNMINEENQRDEEIFVNEIIRVEEVVEVIEEVIKTIEKAEPVKKFPSFVDELSQPITLKKTNNLLFIELKNVMQIRRGVFDEPQYSEEYYEYGYISKYSPYIKNQKNLEIYSRGNFEDFKDDKILKEFIENRQKGKFQYKFNKKIWTCETNAYIPMREVFEMCRKKMSVDKTNFYYLKHRVGYVKFKYNQEVEEVKTTIEETQEVEEVKTTIEEIQHDEEVAIKIKHKIIPDSEWLEYIPDDDTVAKYILDYIKDNIKIYKKNIELCNVRFVYVADSIQIRILTSEDITANYPMLIKRGYLEDCFRVEMDDCMAYKADFLKGIKYKNFFRKSGFHYKITDDEVGHTFFQLEKEILEYARLTNCEAIDTKNPNFKPRLINPHKEPEPINDAKSQMEQMKKLRKGFGKKWTLF